MKGTIQNEEVNREVERRRKREEERGGERDSERDREGRESMKNNEEKSTVQRDRHHR